MKIEFEHAAKKYSCDLSKGTSLAIRIDFDGDQPNHFGAPKASRAGLKLGNFVGRTSQGSGCNVDKISIVPHCNGTHTETVAHIVNQDVFVGDVVPLHPMVALIVTLEPQSASDTGDQYRPPFETTDRIISAKQIKEAVGDATGVQALIIRTMPNPLSKKTGHYDQDHQPAFFSVDAMQAIVEMKVKHLLTDLPSVDRMYDDGLLTNHHLFWNVSERSHELTDESHREKTISEMVFVPDEVKDGFCLLSLQVPGFGTDAAPSRPVVYQIEELTSQ